MEGEGRIRYDQVMLLFDTPYETLLAHPDHVVIFYNLHKTTGPCGAGPLVDEAALVAGLRGGHPRRLRGRTRGARQPLAAMDNVVLSSHNANDGLRATLRNLANGLR